jgi:hypothetical protein
MAILCRSNSAKSAVLGAAAGLPAPPRRRSGQENLIFTAGNPAHWPAHWSGKVWHVSLATVTGSTLTPHPMREARCIVNH